jgi:Ras-related protein Rab-32
MPSVKMAASAGKHETKEYLFKVLVIGELGTGKTSFIKRYVHQFFSSHYRATIGVDFALKVIKWSRNGIVRVQLWDIAGQERFGQMTRVYYKEAAGAIIVFDVSRQDSFEAVLKWKTDLDSKVCQADGAPIPTLLLANKCDQSKVAAVGDPKFLDQFCQDHGFVGWFYTSPKENVNIDESANFLIKSIITSKRRLTQDSDDDTPYSESEAADVVNLKGKTSISSSCC